MENKSVCFSVIVPAYNSASFIGKCVESVLSQTYSDFELILVNDGSSDNTAEICGAYAANDARIKLISKENGGHTSARNAGLKLASGEYVVFLDSDDWLCADALERCYEHIRLNSPDVLVFRIINTLTKRPFENGVPDGFYKLSESKEKIIDSLLMDESGRSVFVKGLIGKAFKREIILPNQLAVPTELRIAEDAAAFVGAVADSLTVGVISDATYFYFVREGSVSHSADKDAFSRLPFMVEYYKKKLADCRYDLSAQMDRYLVAQMYTAALMVLRSGGGKAELNSGLDAFLRCEEAARALKSARFRSKGYKLLIKKFILRHRLWHLAKLIDR